MIEVQGEKNKDNVRCQFCSSLMLKSGCGKYVEQSTFELPLMQQKRSKDHDDIATEPQREFWVVDDMFIFENIGFSNTTADKRKYLVCADCDMGPVGYHDIESKLCYVALKRVQHGDALPLPPASSSSVGVDDDAAT